MISTACSWVNISTARKAAILTQRGQNYFGGRGQFYIGGDIALYVFSHAQDILTHPSATNPASPKGDELFHITELATFLFLVTLAIWLLRILVRITLSNLHQGTDATSRATMTQAYLALITEKGALAEKDRILVLSTLFRPMATGLIKDDSMPPSVIELLSRVAGGNK